MTMKFSDLSNRFLAWASKCRRPSTVAVYRHYFSSFSKAFEDPSILSISPAMVTQWASKWHDVQAIKRLFNWAVSEAQILPSHSLGKVKHPPKGVRRRIFKPAEQKQWLRRCKRDLRTLLVAYRESMARPQELRQASWEDLRPFDPSKPIRDALAAGAAAIVLYDFKDHAKRQNTEKPRTILLSPRLCRLLVRLFDRSISRSGPIFLTKRGRPWTANALRCRFRKLRSKLGINRDRSGETIVPYTFRHTGATFAAAAGVRDRTLADVLGHVDTKTTSRYLHLDLQHLQKALSPVWNPGARSIPAESCKAPPKPV